MVLVDCAIVVNGKSVKIVQGVVCVLYTIVDYDGVWVCMCACVRVHVRVHVIDRGIKMSGVVWESCCLIIIENDENYDHFWLLFL